MKFTKSLEYLNRAERIIPIASQTFSKSPKYYPIGASPLFIEKGLGSHVFDIDGNEYVDWVCGLGPITLGYHYPAVDNAVIEQLNKGIIFTQPSPLETELAEKLVEIIPCAEMVRFLKTGSEACQAAVRIARAYTNREKICSWGYHGWHSEFSVITERPKGIPQSFSDYILPFAYNDIDSLKEQLDKHPGEVAAVIMEPVIATPPKKGYFEELQKLCKVYDILLIWDEVVTGMRWSLGGASEYFNIVPDLVCLGKGIANGLPLSVVCGKREIMKMMEWDSPVFVSSTHGGECLSLAAGLATVNEMQTKKTIEHCWNIGKKLRDGLSAIGLETIGYDCRPSLVLPNDQVWKSKLLEQLFLRGVMIHIGGLINVCYSHTDSDVNKTLNAFEDILRIIDKVELKGQVAVPAFRRM